MTARTSSENVTSRFCNHFSIIQTHYAWKMCSNYPGIKLEPALGTWEEKIEHLSLYAHVVHTTAKQVISRRRKKKNVYKMSKDEKCTCKACKFSLSNMQICGVLLPSSSWLLKLPIIADFQEACWRAKLNKRRYQSSRNSYSFSALKAKKQS